MKLSLQNDFANRSDMIYTAPGNDLQNRFTERCRMPYFTYRGEKNEKGEFF